MKKLIPLYTLLFLFFLTACNNEKTSVAENVNQSPIQKTQVTQKALKRDTTPPRKARSRVMIDRSRDASKMEKDYPFDIDLKTAEGKVLKSSDVLKKNGKPTVVLFWLTTCGPCRMEMAAIKKEFETWKGETDFNLVAISTDFEKNYPRFVEMTKTNEWQWETYNDVNREFRKVMPGGLNGLPQTFIFDAKGSIAYHKRKYRPGDEKTLYAKIKEIAAM